MVQAAIVEPVPSIHILRVECLFKIDAPRVFLFSAMPQRLFPFLLVFLQRKVFCHNLKTTNDMKEEFISILKATNRKGVGAVLTYLEKSGFYDAPASVNRHLNHDGGLLEHSFNVYRAAMALRRQMIELKPELEPRLPEESIAIATLLHDVCKANIYHKTTKYRKDSQGRWEQYAGYDVDYSRFPFGHGEKSVVMLLRLGLELTNDELLAIRWHMGAWDLSFQSYESKSNISVANDVPLVTIVQAADVLSAHLLED